MKLLTLAQADRLPAKPVDPDGRPVSWLWLTGAPGFDYRGEWVAVDQAWIDERLEAFRKMTGRGYRPPVLREHRPDGERVGDVLTLAAIEMADGPALVGAVGWADPAMPEKIANGEVRYVSPQFKSIRDDAGQELPLALTEVSLASKPHQKRASSHILASEQENVMENEVQAPAEGQPSTEDRLVALEKGFSEMKSGQVKILEKLEMLAKPAEEAPSEEPEVDMACGDKPNDLSEGKSATDLKLAELEKQLNTERKARRRAEFDRVYATGATIGLSEDLRDTLFELSESNPEAFGKLRKAATLPEKKGSKDEPPRRADIAWGVSLAEGAGKQAAPGSIDLTEATDEDLDRMAVAQSKGDAAKALDIYTDLYSKRAAQLAGGTR